MDYILIPSKTKTETTFLLNLLKKMQKDVSMISAAEMEDLAFARALQEAEKTPKGSLKNVKSHLGKIIKN